MPDPLVVVVAARGGARFDPEVVVLAVTVDRQRTCVAAARVRAHRALDDREHAMCGDADEMRPGPDVVDDPFHRDDRTAARAERAPHTLEERGLERDVARAVGDRRVQQRDVGLQRSEQPDRAERTVDPREVGVLFHRRARDRAGHDRRKSARARFQSLRECKKRPVLDFDLAAFVGAREHRIGSEVRERVTGITGNYLLHETATKEQCAEARQRKHDQRELRVPAPPLPNDLAGRRRPARVPDHRMQHVASLHVRGHGVGQRASLVIHTGNVLIPTSGQPVWPAKRP